MQAPRLLPLLLALPFLVAMLAMPGQAITPPAESAWKTPLLDPWGYTPGWATQDQAADGDLGVVGCSTNLDFHRTTSASDVDATVVNIDSGVAAGCQYPEVEWVTGDTWVASWYNGVEYFVYVSTNDGAAWTQKLATTKTVNDADLVVIDGAAGKLGLVLSTTDASEVRWFRTSNLGTSWDRSDVAIIDGTLAYGHVVALRWSAGNLQLLFGTTGAGACGTCIVGTVTSNDGGSFWSASSTVCNVAASGGTSLTGTNWLNAATDGTVAYVYCSYLTPNSSVTNFCKLASFGAACSAFSLTGNVGTSCTSSWRSQGRNAMVAANGAMYLYTCQDVNTGYKLWTSTGSTPTVVAGTTLPTSITSGIVEGLAYQPSTGLLTATMRNAAWSGRFEIHAYRFTLPSAVTPTTISVTNLVEADVDGAGTVIIARTDLGDEVNSYSVSAGAEIGSYATADCTGPSGVSAFNKEGTVYLSFADCDGSGDVDTLRVRSSVLGDPAFPSGCGDECQADNEQFDDPDLGSGLSNDDFDVPSDMKDLATLSTAPYSFTFRSGGTNYAYAVWTFSTYSGEIGLVGVLYNYGADNYGERELIQVNPGYQVADFCSWRNNDAEKDYIAGIALNGPTVVAEADFSIEDQFGGIEDIHVSAGTVLTNVIPWGKANSIACVANHALIKRAADGALFFINVTGPTGEIGQTSQVWTLDTDDSSLQSVTVSASEKYAAWRKDSTTLTFAYQSNGTTLVDFAVPSGGTWVGMELDGTGCQLFVYQASEINIYDMSPYTDTGDCAVTIDDSGELLCGANCPTAGDDSDTVVTDGNMFLPAGSTLPPGFSEATLKFFLGILFIAALTIGLGGGLYAVTKNNAATKVGSMVGAGGGFLGSFALGLWPWWILTVVVVLAVAGIFLMRARSG